MMDTLIEQKKGFKKKYISYVIAGLLLTLAAGWLFFGNRTRRVHVDRNTLNIQPVMVGLFNDYMRVNGQVLPIRTVQLSVTEGGMVAEKIVEEGTMVKQGEVIVRLTNPMLNLSILDSEAQLAEKQNFLRNTLLDMEQNRLSLKKNSYNLILKWDGKSGGLSSTSVCIMRNLCREKSTCRRRKNMSWLSTDTILWLKAGNRILSIAVCK